MDNNVLVSAIITTCKRKPDMLKRAIDSVVNQTYRNIEIIIVDDSPFDYEYRDEVKALAESYKAIGLKYIQHSQSKGACAARNTGIENSTGKYIAFLDDDDEWLPLKTEKQLEKFVNEEIGLVYCGSYSISGNSKSVQRRIYKSGYIFDDLIYENIIGSTSFPLCNRKAVLDAGMFDPDMPAAQDFDLWLRIAQKYKVDYVEMPLVNYYFHNCGQITNNRERKALAYERILNKNLDYLKKHRKAYAVRVLRISEFCVQSDFKKAYRLFWKGLFIYPFGFSELKEATKTLLYCKFKNIIVRK